MLNVTFLIYTSNVETIVKFFAYSTNISVVTDSAAVTMRFLNLSRFVGNGGTYTASLTYLRKKK